MRKRFLSTIFIFAVFRFASAQAPVIISFAPVFATRFDTVSIKGVNFTGTTTVSFGDQPAASFQILSDTVVRAVVGNGATGKIKLSTGALSDTSDNLFSYHPYHTNIGSFTPTTGTGQTLVTITGSQLIGTTEVRFGNLPADSFTVVSNTKIVATVGLGNSGYVSVINNNVKDSLPGFTYFVTPPVITNILPASGAVGTQVVITGTGFGPSPASTIVYFGSAKAVVTAASRTSITVSVPPGADYKPVTVTYNGYTAYSRKPFIATFPGAASVFTTSSFEAQLKQHTNGSNPKRMAAGDFDNDGKVDMAVVYGYFGTTNNTVSVFRNTGNYGYLNFTAPVEFIIGTQSYSGYDIAASDIDGDGKLDLVAMSSGDNVVGILKNTSTPGTISFAPKVDFITSTSYGPDGTSPNSMTVADFDVDGRPDLAFANFGLDNWCKITYMRNTSQNGIISFGPRSDYSVVDAWTITAGHLNSDNKPDLAVGINVNGSFMRELNLFNNTSTGGTISFAQSESVGPENTLKPSKIAIGDFDNDGRPDMVVVHTGGNSVSVYRNLSTGSGSIMFDFPVELPVENNSQTRGLAISDADGDGKPDIVITRASNNTIGIFKNRWVGGVILFAPVQNFVTGKYPEDVMAADVNGDGKPDLITTNSGDTSISILKNTIGAPINLCPPVASYTISAGISGSSYVWQIDTGDHVFTNIQNNGFYAGATTSTLQLINVPSSFTGYQYRCLANGVYSNTFMVRFENKWTGLANSFWNNAANWYCGAVPDGNTDVIITSGNVVLNTNGVCHTLTVLPTATFTVNAGSVLTVTH